MDNEERIENLERHVASLRIDMDIIKMMLKLLREGSNES